MVSLWRQTQEASSSFQASWFGLSCLTQIMLPNKITAQKTGVVFTRILSLKLPSIQGCPRMNKVKKKVFYIFKKTWHCFIGRIYTNPLERQKAPMKGKGTVLKGEPTVLQRKLQESAVPFVKLMALLSIRRKRERNGHRY